MDIFFKWSSDGGVTWQDSINLSDNPETSSRPRICTMPFVTLQGVAWLEFTVVWYDYSTGDAEILARKGKHFIIPVELTSFTSEVQVMMFYLSGLLPRKQIIKDSKFREAEMMEDGKQKMENLSGKVLTKTNGM